MLKNFLKHIMQTNKRNYLFSEKSNADEIELKEQPISENLEETIAFFKKIYSIPDNIDVSIRTLLIGGLNKKAAILAITTITDIKLIEEYALEPLIHNKIPANNAEDILPIQKITAVQLIKNALSEINDGNAVLFIDGSSTAYSLSASNFQSRDIDTPETEIVLKGPKEAFMERANTNISLVRKRIKNENLMVETLTISKRSRNTLNILYIKDLANADLLKNIKERLSALEADSIQNLALLEQHIEERKLSIFPTILYTERPDRAVSFLEDGYIILLMDNSPASLVLPATFWSFFHISEDHYLRFLYGNFTRILRFLALFITLFTSAIYVGITNYHSEMIPADLLLAISATREKVPFPALLEVLMMEMAFELIREGGLRVPTAIGPTIGIVGALILGQAAVQANIVSPIVVIVVALSGVSSFLLSDISMNFAIRLIRYCFIITAGLFGFYGMTALFAAGLFYMVSIHSFGVPYLSPMTPNYASSKDTLFRRILQNEKFRPGYLKPKDMKKS